MSQERKIKLFSTVGKVKGGELEGIKDVADLKAKFKDLKIDLKGTTILNAKTDEEISLDTLTSLPEGDLQLYIMPAKTKSGFIGVAA